MLKSDSVVLGPDGSDSTSAFNYIPIYSLLYMIVVVLKLRELH